MTDIRNIAHEYRSYEIVFYASLAIIDILDQWVYCFKWNLVDVINWQPTDRSMDGEQTDLNETARNGYFESYDNFEVIKSPFNSENIPVIQYVIN